MRRFRRLSKARRIAVMFAALYTLVGGGLIAAPTLGLMEPIHRQPALVSCDSPQRAADSTATTAGNPAPAADSRTSSCDNVQAFSFGVDDETAGGMLSCCVCLFLIALVVFASGGDGGYTPS